MTITSVFCHDGALIVKRGEKEEEKEKKDGGGNALK